jgi:hypothetical protein
MAGQAMTLDKLIAAESKPLEKFNLLACYIEREGYPLSTPVRVGHCRDVVAIIVDDTEYRAYRCEYDSRRISN